MFQIRRHLRLLIAILAITLAIPGLFRLKENLNSCQIHFTSPSGFYEDTLSLGIEGQGIFDVYYTLDGSVPTRNSIPYRPGSVIAISDASENENILSKRTDISAGYTDYIPSLPAFAIPEEKVDKCTIIRASAISKTGDVLSSVSGVYFVGFQNKPAYENISVVSIFGQPEDLFGYETGILVTGKTFDDFVKFSRNENGEFVPPDTMSFQYWWWPANYRYEGDRWERQVHITVFDPDREIVLDQQCGIRNHGRGSRGFPSRSIRCIAREEYADGDTFNFDWFGEGIEPKKFVLYSGGDDYIFKLKDYMGQKFARELNFASLECRPCCLFINGEYWGFYFLTENYNRNYISDHYGVTEDNVIMIKNGEVAEGTNREIHLFNNTNRFISQNDMSQPENYRKACGLIDIDNYIDYYAFQIYIGRRNDWPSSNFAAWRTREQEDSPFGDCKWRWMLFDLNSGGISAETLFEDTLAYVLDVDPVFASLWESAEFRSKFSDRIHYIGSAVLRSDVSVGFVDDYDAAFRAQLAINNVRFFNSAKETEYDAYMEEMRQFFAGRYDVVQQFLADHMMD